jgi:Icc-related predicted phosphoesterase
MLCFFCSDLHGSIRRYETLFGQILKRRPKFVFLGGDLLPGPLMAFAAPDPRHQDFVSGYLVPTMTELRLEMGTAFPEIMIILGNDDGRFEEAAILDGAVQGCWAYLHDRTVMLAGGISAMGYSFVPPTPFRLKDWERYDVSRYVDPGCLSPEEGSHSVDVPLHELRYTTIREDLARMTEGSDLSKTICLFHSPPYGTPLDRAALDGKSVDHVPLDVHVGSIAIQRFIETRQPLCSLHGHIHESVRLTGKWRHKIGHTHLFGGAHDGPELALISFFPQDLERATRELL